VGDARDELAQIRRVVYNETVFLRHYFGQVVDNQDPNKKGRVKATILDLGWDTADKVQWAWPRAGHSLDVPAVGEWVEVYFMMGDRNKPAYLPGAAELTGNLPADYSSPDDPVLFQDPKTKEKIKYTRSSKTLDVTASKVNLSGGTAAVARKGDVINVDLTTDPTNLPMIIAVCAMFGMTIVPPLVGKITGGSSKVKAG